MASMAACFTLPPNRCLRLVFKASLLANRSQALSIIQTHNFRGVTSKVGVVRGSNAAIRPGVVVKSDKLPSDVRKRAMEAVDACGRRVTVGDVAGRAGLKLHEAQNALQALASDTHGFLEVSDEGDVLYVFHRDYRAKLVGKSFVMRVEPLLEKAKAKAEHLARASFGITLIASIILVFAAILVCLLGESGDIPTSSSSSHGSGGSLPRRSYHSSTIDFPWYRTEVSRNQQEKPQTDAGELKFGESFFSFVFGDGDPNQGNEEKRWKMIARYISSNGGVVAAEELAPYLDAETSGGTLTDEANILPVLLRYEGQPLIDDKGNILYQFPSLQRTASRKKTIEIVVEADKFFKEEKWKFSKTSIAKRAMIIGLSGFNLVGVIILRLLLKDPTVAQHGYIKFITSIFLLLQIYAGSFFLIPLLRWFVLLKTNADIEKRNQARLRFARDIEFPDLSLRRKLLSARNMAERTVIGQDRIVYSSGKDLVEQDLSWELQIDKS